MTYCSDCETRVDGADAVCPECGNALKRSDDGHVFETSDGQSAAEGESTRPETRRTSNESSEESGVAGTGVPRSQAITFVGVALAAVGAFLPWITATSSGGQASASGIAGDGVLTLAIAAVGGIVASLRWRRATQLAVAACGTLVLLLGGFYLLLLTFSGSGGQIQGTLEPGLGLYATVLGGTAIVMGAILGY